MRSSEPCLCGDPYCGSCFPGGYGSLENELFNIIDAPGATLLDLEDFVESVDAYERQLEKDEAEFYEDWRAQQ